LAHELGHLVLHGLLDESIDEEMACNRFASAFLLPEVGLFQHLGERRSNVDPKELYFLKHEYGLSMAACLYRSADLGVITEEKKTPNIYTVLKKRLAQARAWESLSTRTNIIV
jgi:Zn-dependent peptidase ImmA (M78 family)